MFTIEPIKFRIRKFKNDTCQITSLDIRGIYKSMADGSSICSLDVMLSEMEEITRKVKETGHIAVFVFD